MNIIMYDHNKDHIVQWTDTVYSDASAAKYVWGVGFHWYSGDGFDAVAKVRQNWPDKHIFASESCNCPAVILEDWARAEAYAHDIIGDLNAGAEGWTDWNIVLDETGGPNHLGNECDAPIIGNTKSQTLHYQPSYYAIGHFSRFLPRDSVRVAAHVTGNDAMEVTAWRTPKGDIVVITINRWWQPAAFTLTIDADADAVDAKADTDAPTDSSNPSVPRKSAHISMPAHSITTLVF